MCPRVWVRSWPQETLTRPHTPRAALALYHTEGRSHATHADTRTVRCIRAIHHGEERGLELIGRRRRAESHLAVRAARQHRDPCAIGILSLRHTRSRASIGARKPHLAPRSARRSGASSALRAPRVARAPPTRTSLRAPRVARTPQKQPGQQQLYAEACGAPGSALRASLGRTSLARATQLCIGASSRVVDAVNISLD